MPPGAPARLALALGLGLWLGGLAGAPGRGCGPCAPPCLCGPAPGTACLVNCSGRGLHTLGPGLRIPADTTVLDISHNLLQTLDVGLLANLSMLVELDISNNRISTLEEGIFANLFNLSEINLSRNPFECDCGLVWLRHWAEERQVHVVQPEEATCTGPGPLAGQPLFGLSLVDSSCGEEYVACLPDNGSDTMVLVVFSTVHKGLLAPEACGTFCFLGGHGLAALSEQGQCLCGTDQTPNTSMACLSLCSSPLPPTPACGGPTFLQHVFPSSLGATLVGPYGPLASGQPAAFHITTTSLPLSTICWDFGDGSPKLDVAGPAATHRYLLPGHYHVTAVLALGDGSATLETEVQVEVVPAALELVCPSSVHRDESLELSIRNRGGSDLEATYSILALGEGPVQVVHPLCPSDTEIFPGNGHCYRLVAEKASWLQAQEQCRAWAGAALAMVDSPAIQHFLVSQVTRSLDVWIGFSAVEGAETGLQPQGEAFSLESCQNWLPGEPHPATAEHCVRLGPAGQCNTDLCSAPHSYVCELQPGGLVWDAENFLMGVPGGGLQGPLILLTPQEAILPPRQPVEVMVFPGLSPSREAFLTTAEFETQELGGPAQLRLQVYRPSGEAGAPENRSEPDNGTEPAPRCMPEGCWCPGASLCVPLDAACHLQACANESMVGSGLPSTTYALWREFLFSVPAGPPTQYLVTFHGQDVRVLPGDLIGLQHDAGSGALLQCPLAPNQAGPKALYLSTNASNWLTHLPTPVDDARPGPACILQLVTATEQLSPLLGLKSNPGLKHPGRYEVRATVGNSVSTYNLSCSFNVVSPVAGLRVIYPATLDGLLYVPTSGSILVIQVDSGANATAMAYWPGGNVSAPLEAACPTMDALKLTCTQEINNTTNNTLFSVLVLPGLSQGEHAVDIVVQNSAGQANLTLTVMAEEPIRGLYATPVPEARVLQGALVRYSPMVEAGTNVVFRWTIDDKQSLTFHNVVFNVIYQSAAIFKLSLTASNHVSNVTVNYNVTVERMNRMQSLLVSAVPAVLAPNTMLALMARVLVDSAVEVAFLWTFGDGQQVLGQFKPPYNKSFQVPDPTVAQVLVEHNATHTYTKSGEYNLTVLVSNAFENLTQQVPVSVRDTLPAVAISVSRSILVAGWPVVFSLYPLPLPDGVLYTWDFGDGSPVLIQSQPAVNYTYTRTGTYHVCLEVNNTVSIVVAHTDVHVFQELSGMSVRLSPAVEQGAPVVVSATVETGDNVTWTFDMGDGTVFTGPTAIVQHIYLRAQNYTVTVGATSPAGHLTQSLPIRVFVLEVLRIEPATCIPIQPDAQLTAHVAGDPAHYLFDWTFGDGSSNMTVQGQPTVTHNFTRSGTFPLALILSSHVNKAHYFTSVCVEPEVENITLRPEQQFVQLGDEARLVAFAWPPFPYRYTWDFGIADTVLTHAWGPEATVAYRDPGSYLVTVTVSNNVSAVNDSALVEVQEPMVVTGIRVNASHVLELQQPYLFSAMGHGHPATYLWELGDGTQLVGSEVTHVYNSTDMQDLVLDGSKSYDPNLEDDDQTPLTFHWACVASTQIETNGCVLNFGPRGSSVVTIPRERLEAGIEYTFNLTVWKAGRKEEAASQTVLVRSGQVPIVSLECVSCKAQAVYEVSRSSYVYLEGHCHNCSSGSKHGRWAARTFSNKTLVLDETTTSTGSSDMRLVVRRGVLRDGEGYIFTLTVLGHSGKEEGCASIHLSPNRPPLGGVCYLFPLDAVWALTTKVHFECVGWQDAEDASAPLVYALLLQRCHQGHCEEFCIYKGSLSTYAAVLPPGFQPEFEVGLAVVVQDQLGAAVVALNRSLAIVLPEPNSSMGLTPWLHSLTASVLPGLLRQADPQHVIEYSLALITVLNEYEQALDVATEPDSEQQLRAQMRKNITETLVSLRVNTVDDIQQITAALAQCMVSSRELVCRSCLKQTLHKLEGMMRILQAETTQGTVTPTTIADSILNITGDLIHLASSDIQSLQPLGLGTESPSLMVASKAYNLSSALMCILMRSRVLNEEPLTLAGEEIVAQGKRSDPRNLLCYGNASSSGCHFSIPEAFSGALSNISDVVQLIFLVDSNPFPFGYISNYTVSTKVASMAFQTQAGTQIPIERLAKERAITVKVPNNSDQAAHGLHTPMGLAVVQPQASVSAVVTLDNSNPAAGLHLQLTYTMLSDRYLSEEPEPYLAVYLHSAPQPNEYNCSASRKISLEMLTGTDHRPYTFFIAPGTGYPGGSYHLNLTSHFHWSALEVSVGLYTSLCQYFSEEEMMWRTEGLVPLEDTSPSQAVCLTRHLTAFGASLFVPPSHIHFIFPEPAARVNYIVLLTCAMCLVTYAIMAVILRRLDQLDVSWARVIPFCGKGGRFKYEIMVKTGWGRGSGTTAHVGIMLYGADSRSGHRHLDGDRAFHRNSLDIFRIATPHSLGNVWKIRVWHDNKGLSPAWFLQHVIVRDLQNAHSTFFLVNDWLSVETEANGGLVEKEVLAASDAALWQFQRLLVAELQRGFFDKHIWLSIWDRPARSRFTRVQRATCCVLLICLFLGANAVWYGVVGDTTYSVGPVSSLVPPSADTVAIGLVSSVVVYPVYLAILFLFRMSRSKVAGGPSPSPTGQQALELDSCLDSSMLESSFLTFSGLRTEVFSGQGKSDLFLDDSKSLACWPSSEGTLSWPDLLSDPSIVGSTLQRLARGQTGQGLGSEEDSLSLVSPSSPAKYFSVSDEDLIRQVLAEGANSLVTQDTLVETDLITGLSSVSGEKTETPAMQTFGSSGPSGPGLTWEQPPLAQLPRTGLVEGLQKRLMPAWCASLAHGISLVLVTVAMAVSGWVGASFPPSVSVMWLLSSSSSFLASFLGWEPLKVLLEALYFSLVAKRLHPDEDDMLVESPAVTPVSERVPRVRPPHGFALFLAKEEARKVKRLHSMLRSLLVHMLFLLVTLLANYGDASCHNHAYRLQSAIKQELDSRAFLAITRSDEFWPWMSHVLLPYVHGNQSSPELGPPRLRQVRLQEALCPDPPSPGVHLCPAARDFSTTDYGVGWQSATHNSSETWTYSVPDLLGTWYWGYCAVYDSGGYVQELGLSLEESRERLHFLQQHNWLDSKSRAVFVELTRYSPAVGLHAAVTLRLEFPATGHALAALSVRPFALLRFSTGLSLPLLTSVCLLLFALYFSVAEARAWHREGCSHAMQPGAWAQWLLVTLTAAAALVRLAQLGTADRQWTRFLRGRPHHFTSFDQVAQLSTTARGLAASLLFLLLVKTAQQLRFVRQWSVFGKTLCRALPELLGATLGLVILGVAYAQLAVLLVSCTDSLHNMVQALVVLYPGAKVSTLCLSESWHLSPLLCTGLWALRLCGALRLGAVLLRWRYHSLQGELYRPAWEPQDYEMVELFLRRLRLWMGFSKVKEFRHKVRFEGMEPLPSRSSRGSKSSPEAPPPSGGSDASHPSTSSSQLDASNAGPGRPGAQGEPSRLHAVFEALLTQFDRLNQATEDVYQLEQRLQRLQGYGSAQFIVSPRPSPSPSPKSAQPSQLAETSQGMDLAVGHSRTPLWAKNKVHPSST
ncbi:polycystin-1 isoform X3 [Octodon degus]|uniref:Polycystin-1 isoform X3 n=1 Tax=Octodon degus TaxID=10160 RepID=A0A6P6E5U7_OCTDE|nr:polycystin-1 isoform X3 [Octodon degus]